MRILISMLVIVIFISLVSVNIQAGTDYRTLLGIDSVWVNVHSWPVEVFPDGYCGILMRRCEDALSFRGIPISSGKSLAKNTTLFYIELMVVYQCGDDILVSCRIFLDRDVCVLEKDNKKDSELKFLLDNKKYSLPVWDDYKVIVTSQERINNPFGFYNDNFKEIIIEFAADFLQAKLKYQSKHKLN